MRRQNYQAIATVVALASLMLAAASLWAQTTVSSILRKVSFRDYLNAVDENSLDLQAQRQTIASASAGVSIAGVSPDPQFTAGIASKELYGPNKPNASTALTAGVAFTIETAGKRGARIRSAESSVQLATVNVEAFQRQLYADAAAAFVESCRTRGALEHKESSLRSMRDIVHANELRFQAGDIGKLELTQSEVEAHRFGADVVTARGDAAAAEENLSSRLGKRYPEVFPGGVLDCELRRHGLGEELDALIHRALENRDDVRVAKATVESARDKLGLAKSNRWMDPVVNVGVTNTPRIDPLFDSAGNVTNMPAERSTTLGLTVTIPIPLSRLQRGELIQAESDLTQAQLLLRSTLLKAETEVRATHAQYQAAAQNVQNYTEHVLNDSDRVLEGVRTSYRKGAARLLDLLNAQRTSDDLYLGYLQALADLANATVKLQLSTGMRPDL